MTVYKLIKELVFPSPEDAEPDGLLAVGGDLSVKRLLLAYQMGIFPWYTEETPILWWSPDPRLVVFPEDLKISKSLKRIIKKDTFNITLDQAFEKVIRNCATAKRSRDEGTWIVDEMIDAYCELHRQGFAHSAESWQECKLVGGLYGVSLGKVFFGESMFSTVSNASKVAFVHLVQLLQSWEFSLIDCQVTTDLLLSFGARESPRVDFLYCLRAALLHKTHRGKWCFPEKI